MTTVHSANVFKTFCYTFYVFSQRSENVLEYLALLSFLCFSANDCQQLCHKIYDIYEIYKNITIIWLLSLFTKEMWSMPRLDFVPIAKVIKKKFAWCLNFENGSESNMYSNGRTWFEFTLSCGFILYLVKHFSWMALQLHRLFFF